MTPKFAPLGGTSFAPAMPMLSVSADPARLAWLGRALGSLGAVAPAPTEPMALVARIAESGPAVVFIDFTELPCGQNAPGTLSRAHDASQLAQAVRDACPGVPMVALGTLSSPVSAVLALRAGVRDFIDVNGNPADVLAIVKRLADERPEPVSRHGKITVLLGARVGMGVSTLAANLAICVQKRVTDRRKTTALLDLGLPAADSALLLDTQSELHFVDAVRNLRRFDETFVNTAFARHSSGLALTALPADLAAMRSISFASAVSTLNRLRAYFDHQIVDMGGFTNLEFVAQVAHAADDVWLVCDPNVTSAVSAKAMLDALNAEPQDNTEITPLKPSLIVNKFDAALNFGADQLAARLELPLLAVLPERAQALGRAVNQGRLLSDLNERDPYVRALAPLISRLAGEPAVATKRTNDTKAPTLGHLLPTFLRRS
ncbi:fimbrial protein [Caballeronia sp. BR00000012568055]|uniref:AAA family ATPase n=1 Tax=Caballeronia sp. BR00000012568055 TaxID=2918761 RepID=UPI0023F8E957|nr:fimbrial protein [Caballeronia sp. BR00000012568055]